MFTCPNCRGALARAQNDFGIFWICGQCGGRAASLSVLRKAVRRESVDYAWAAARDRRGFSSRPCPTCARDMTEVAVEGGTMNLDVCRLCQFIWFDGGELESLPAAPVAVSRMAEPELPAEAREALAIHRVQQIAEQARMEDLSPDSGWKTVPAIFGFPVESDTAPLERLPWLTWSMAALIAIVSIWAFADLENVIQRFALVPAEMWRYGGLTLVTSFFLHAGILHLAGNLYFLLIFGDNVEDYVGRGKFLLLLLLATVAGDVLHSLFDPVSTRPCVGASGGISGLIAFYALQFPHARLGFLIRRYYRWIQIPAWGAFLLWLGLQFLGAYEQVAGFSNVSAFAHLGGAGVGFLFWLWLKWRAG
jgi:membrane associated rhomboid family serine protease/Zn-finger nucleic acid-binding protein